MVPEVLYHYYEKSRLPFLSMSELSTEEFTALMGELSQSGTSENRFDESWKREFYQQFRPYVEKAIHQRFVEKGGRPKIATPRYMTLGPTTWFLNWYQEPAVIEIPLSDIPDSAISFTYPDSMMSYLIAEDRFEPFAKFKMPYHGEVFRLDELDELISAYGMPDENDPKNLEYGNRIIEAQIWDMAPLEQYIRK
jgi:hypothetical protein